MKTDDTRCQQIQADPFGEDWDSALRDHAESCPSCVAFLDCVQRMRSRLQGLPGATRAMPDEMRAGMIAQLAECVSCADQAPEGNRSRILPLPRLARRALIPAAMAACLVLGVFVGRNFDPRATIVRGETRSTVGHYIADVTHDHYLLERIGRPLEVTLTNADELSNWLTDALAFSFTLPSDHGSLALQGGRVWHTVGRLSAMACYTTAAGQKIYLFAVPAANLDLTGAPSALVAGTRVFAGHDWGNEARVWVKGDLALALTAPDGRLPADWPEIFLP